MQQDRVESSTSHTGSYSVQNHTNHPAGCRNVMKPAANPLPGCPSLATLSYGEREMVVFAAMMDQDIAPLELRVLIYINHVLYSSSGRADISQALLARRMQSSLKRICAAVSALEQRGYIQVDRCNRQRKYGLIRQDVVRAVDPQWVPEPVPIEEEWVPEPVPIVDAQVPVPVPVEPQWVPEPVPRTFHPGTVKEETPSSSPHICADPPKPAARKSARRKPEHSLPEDWQPDEDLIQRCVKTKGLSEVKVRQETEQFLNYYLGNPSKRWADWNRCWWNWMNRVAPGGAYHKPVKAAGGNERVRANNLGLARPLTKEEMRRKPHVPIV